MSVFDNDPIAGENVYNQALQNPLSMDDLKPAWYSGVWKTPVTGLASAINDAALLTGDAATPALRKAARPVDELFGTKIDEWLVQQQQVAVDNIKDWSPDPRSTGWLGMAAHGLFNIIPEAVVTGGPEVPAVLQGYKGYRRGMGEGLDPLTALGQGTIEGVATYAGMKIPMTLGTGAPLAANVATGVGVSMASGVVTRGAMSDLLEARGYHDMAQQYKVFDQEAMFVDAVMGAGFGVFGHWAHGREAKKISDIRASDLQAALTAKNQIHMEVDTLPGLPTDPAARQAHIDAVTKAMADLAKGDDVSVSDDVTAANFVEQAVSDLRKTFDESMAEHMGPEWQQAQKALRDRGLPDDPELYSIDQRSPVRFTDNVRSAIKEWESTGDTATLISRLKNLKGDLEERARANDLKRGAERERGELWVRERLMRAERHGDISPEQHELMKWMLDKNPAIADTLAISLRANGSMTGEAGSYNPAMRMVTLIKGSGDAMTGAHELLHHTERMMPDEVRAGVREAWINSVERLQRYATETQNHVLMKAIDDAIRAAAGDRQAFKLLAEQIANGELPKDFYQYVNPSEFWAVNAARLVADRAGATGWVGKAKQWLAEFVAKIKSAFGLSDQATIIKGLDAVLKSEGDIYGKMIGQGDFFASGPGYNKGKADGRAAHSAPTTVSKTSREEIGFVENFRKWFGDSKVVDKNGDPLVVYHGTRPGNDITAFKRYSEKDGIYFTPDAQYAEGFVNDIRNGTSNQGAIYPVFLSIKKPYEVTAHIDSKEWNSFVDRGLNREELKKQGYDGAILRDSATGEIDQIIAFEPEQIKSATGNNGQFDPKNAEIYSSIEPRGSDQDKVAEMLRQSAENENRTGVIVGARPGEFGWSITDKDGAPPPIQHPVQRGPRLEKVGQAVRSILEARPFQKMVKDIAGIDKVEVVQIEGTWEGNQEPSFVLRGKDLSEEGASRLARIMGFAFAQDATVVTKHSPDLKEGIPTLYLGSGKVLQKAQLDVIIQAARERGLDLSTSADKKAVKFLHFGEEAEMGAFFDKVSEIADAAGLSDPTFVRTQGDLYEAAEYLNGRSGSDGESQGLFNSEAERSDLLGRLLDTAIIPYAKAIGAEGYRFSPERFAERFGLSDAERELITQKLLPKEGESRSTVPLMTGEEKLDVVPTTVRGKNEDGTPKAMPNVTDIMWALQNRAAQNGLVQPGDYSPKAMKVIAQAIKSEVIYHVQNSTKSAIGWYDAALKAAKAEYKKIFPELGVDKDKEMLFDAVLGITSQGNDVHSNSLFATRVFQLIKDGHYTMTDAVKQLVGTFGGQTRAIEMNLLKFEHLIGRNGYDHMRELFNRKMTVGEWNAELRKNEALFGPDGKPLSVEGAASQKVTGWMVFGPKIGSFINNLHGDYSTLTADLWFSRTWNRMLGFMFQHSPLLEAKQYQEFKDALQAEHAQSTEGKTQNGKVVMKNGKPVPWENGKDVVGMPKEQFEKLLSDPDMMLALAQQLEEGYRKGGYKEKSDLRRRGKNWIESREETIAAPRSDHERNFQQATVEEAQKMIKKQAGIDVTIADIQAALWFHEKELFAKMGASDARSAPADYADAAHAALEAFGSGQLFYVKARNEYIGGDNGKYLGLTIADESGAIVPATKALEQVDAEIASAKQDAPGFDAAISCALRG